MLVKYIFKLIAKAIGAKITEINAEKSLFKPRL